jgi:hypothetical protein
METIQIDLIRPLFSKRVIKIKSMIALLLLSTSVNAAEIRGRIWSENNVNSAPPGAVLTINCGAGAGQEISLKKDGSYSLRSLPANVGCTATIRVTVSGNTISSRSVPVRTNATVVNFNAEVIIANNSAVVLLPR